MTWSEIIDNSHPIKLIKILLAMINKEPIKFIKILFLIIIVFIFISLLIAIILNRFLFKIDYSDIIAITLGAIALPFGAFSLAVSMFIASRQDIQLDKLEKIGEETSITVNSLTTDASIRSTIRKFFYNLSPDDSTPKYKCIYPVYFNPSTPLPQVSQADFYVFHVLGSFIKDEDYLEIEGIPNNLDIEKGKSLQENVILICTKNPWLNKFYEVKTIKKDSNLDEIKNFISEDLKLPCWFVNDVRGMSEEESKNKRNIKIMVSTKPDECGRLEDLLESPANKIYQDAQNCSGNVANILIQSDYAIFARLSESGHQRVIIAGIHQYGTWIIGELLNCLICGDKVDYYLTFLDNNDFICIVTGEFSQTKLKVKKSSIQIYKNYIWVKESDQWTRKYTDKKENN